MPPPTTTTSTTTTTTTTTGNNHSSFSGSTGNQPSGLSSTQMTVYRGMDSEQSVAELIKLKEENIKKEGEVNILRNKLKLKEQDMQRWRTEREQQV